MQPSKPLPALNPRDPAGKVMSELVDVVHGIGQLQSDIDAMRKHLENRVTGEHTGARVLACLLASHLLSERLLKLQIAVMHQEFTELRK